MTVTATHDLRLHGDFSLAGSMCATAGHDLFAYDTLISAQALGQRLLLQSSGALYLGSTAGNSGGVILEANALLALLTDNRLIVAADAQLYTTGDDSLMSLQAPTLSIAGTLRAGGDYIGGTSTPDWVFSGKRATLQISTLRDLVLGTLSTGDGAELTSTGTLSILTGTNAAGVGIEMTGGSRIVADASGGGLWNGTDGDGDGLIRLVSDGDIHLHGTVAAVDDGADVGIVSRSQVLVAAIVQASDRLKIVGGIDDSHVAILVDTLTQASGSTPASGGQLSMVADGSIILSAIDDVRIEGVVGVDGSSSTLGNGISALVDIQSVSGDVTLHRDINVRDSVVITGGNLLAQGGSRVHATATGSTVYLAGRSSIVISAANSADAQDAIVQAGALIHFAAPTVQVDGFVNATGAAGRILVSASRSATFGGTIFSDGTSGIIDVHAGVDLGWGRARLEGLVTQADLLGGSISVHGQGLLQAVGAITLLAGGDVTLDADAMLNTDRSVTHQTVTLVDDTVTLITGYTKEAVGTVTVPEITYQPTTLTQQVGTEQVPVGTTYVTMDVTLEQLGYYNATTKQFREVLVEGIDYLNQLPVGYTGPIPVVNWNDASDEQHPGRTVAVGNRPSGDYKLATYKEFLQLDDAQQWAVLNTLGYKPVYQFSYSGDLDPTDNVPGVANKAVLHETKNASIKPTVLFTPTWAGNPQKVYYVDVANWRDKYVVMPEGAQEDILSLVGVGQTQYLSGDTTADGVNNGTWSATKSTTSGELVGRYVEKSKVLYAQTASAFTNSYGIGDTDGGPSGLSATTARANASSASPTR